MLFIKILNVGNIFCNQLAMQQLHKLVYPIQVISLFKRTFGIMFRTRILKFIRNAILAQNEFTEGRSTKEENKVIPGTK